MAKSKPKTIDEYIAMFPKDVQKILENLRQVIRETALEAEETISYGMPAFKLNGKVLVYFAGWKNHIGFYPAGSLEAFKKEELAFREELASFKQAKGTVQFPFDKPIPVDLVKRIVKFRIKESESEKKIDERVPFFTVKLKVDLAPTLLKSEAKSHYVRAIKILHSAGAALFNCSQSGLGYDCQNH